MSDFLPKDYELPESASRYMKFKQGDNKFRILASPIVGREGWKDKKPVRKQVDAPWVTSEVDKPEEIKHFWAMPVFDYATNSVVILEITQKTVLKAIKSLAEDEDWGSPLNYDLLVTRTGEEMETRYEVKPKPAKPVTEDIVKAWKEVQEAGFDINKLFTNEDPFTNEKLNLDDVEF